MADAPAYSTVMVATDGSKEAQKSVAHAVYLAKAVGAHLIAVYVVDTHRTQSLGVHFSEAVHELRSAGEQAVDEAVALAKGLGITAEPLLVDGHPGRAIVQASIDRKADLIVIGATGKSGFQEMLMGSVSGFVADNARCPVLVVRG